MKYYQTNQTAGELAAYVDSIGGDPFTIDAFCNALAHFLVVELRKPCDLFD